MLQNDASDYFSLDFKLICSIYIFNTAKDAVAVAVMPPRYACVSGGMQIFKHRCDASPHREQDWGTANGGVPHTRSSAYL
jgi:hypothetical protein